eukprot:435231-Amphidinium_carterae.2
MPVAWAPGSWIITHGESIAVSSNDRAYHNPSCVHLQVKGIPPGFRRRSDEDQQRRREKIRERQREEIGSQSGKAAGSAPTNFNATAGAVTHVKEMMRKAAGAAPLRHRLTVCMNVGAHRKIVNL